MTAGFAGFWAAGAGLTLAVVLAAAVFGDGPFEFNGEPVSRVEFLDRLPLLALGLGFPAVYLGAVAVGVWRERAWVRPGVIALWLAVSALLIGQAVRGAIDLATAVGWSAAYLTFIGWYFFRKSNVVAYYRALEAHEREAAGSVHSDPSAAV